MLPKSSRHDRCASCSFESRYFVKDHIAYLDLCPNRPRCNRRQYRRYSLQSERSRMTQDQNRHCSGPSYCVDMFDMHVLAMHWIVLPERCIGALVIGEQYIGAANKLHHVRTQIVTMTEDTFSMGTPASAKT